MMDLTFGEQVKIILRRKGMTIKELAEIIEEKTGKKMSRQNLTQRLGRDNFQEQDMRMIAGILGCPFHLNILDDSVSAEEDIILKEEQLNIDEEAAPAQEEAGAESAAWEQPVVEPVVKEELDLEREITIGELVEEVFDEREEAVFDEDEIEEEVFDDYDESGVSMKEILEEMEALERESHERRQEKEKRAVFEDGEKKVHGWRSYLSRIKKKALEEPVRNIVKKEENKEAEDEIVLDEIFRTETIDLDDEFSNNEFSGEEFEEESQGEAVDFIEEEFKKKSGDDEEDTTIGDVNPYTGHEYKTNSVRMHPSRIGYVQVYDRGEHKWTDMTEWAFLGYQERKKSLLGKDYDPPIYLD